MSTTVPSPTASIGLIEGWGAAVYFCVYLTYLFVRYESELLHWLSLVALPLVVVFLLRRGEARRRSEALTRSRVAAVVLASRRNVLACAVLHSLINALPAMTMIRMGGVLTQPRSRGSSSGCAPGSSPRSLTESGLGS